MELKLIEFNGHVFAPCFYQSYEIQTDFGWTMVTAVSAMSGKDKTLWQSPTSFTNTTHVGGDWPRHSTNETLRAEHLAQAEAVRHLIMGIINTEAK